MLTRRDFMRVNLFGGVWCALGGLGHLACSRNGGRETQTRIIVLGLDGMDPGLVYRMMKEGKLPNFKKLAREGYFGALGTSTPPQSPVAWANFITGCNPGGHGIFDFIHRDPKTYFPYLSTAKSEKAEKTITVGDYIIPLSPGKVRGLRGGRAFWEVMEDYDVPATVFKIPSNYPAMSTSQRTLSGMGTPDILGTYGIFSFFTDQPAEVDQDLGGGRVYPADMSGHTLHASLVGPKNAYRKDTPPAKVDFTVYRDPEHHVAKIVTGEGEFLLNEGEWSPWVRLSFPMMPLVHVRGICRFFLKQVHPHFKLYVTPINIDPSDPSLPISTPADYSRELARRFGLFHTKGLPADTKALDHGILEDGDFLAMDEGILQERLAVYDYELSRFETGVLFFYVSSTDQRSHMFWRLTDPSHPRYEEKLASLYGDAIEKVYRQMDSLLEKTMRKVDKHTLLIVLSDHGFAPFSRGVHLNSWLKEEGFLNLIQESRQGERQLLLNVDWYRTKAYAFGLNGIYVNLQGREAKGIVAPAERRALVDEIAYRLERLTDPMTGKRAVALAHKTSECYTGPYLEAAPDIIAGYARDYRASWKTGLGKIPKSIFETNEKKWSGDHCMASNLLPGILLTNRPVERAQGAALEDLTATMLDALQIPIPDSMQGRSIL